MNTQPIDITAMPDGPANNLLCWNEPVMTPAGRILPLPDGMSLQLEGKRRPRFFGTAKAALRALRKATVVSGHSPGVP